MKSKKEVLSFAFVASTFMAGMFLNLCVFVIYYYFLFSFLTFGELLIVNFITIFYCVLIFIGLFYYKYRVYKLEDKKNG